MMMLLYSALLFLALMLAFPWLVYQMLAGKRIRKGLKERFGFFPRPLLDTLAGKRTLWFHAASVGETLVAKPLIKNLKDQFPDIPIVLSVMTDTADEIARAQIPELAGVIRLPLDFRFIISHVWSKLNPAVIIIMETELWPNLISYAHEQAVPVAVLNGRISDRSYPKYRVFRFFLKPVLRRVCCFAMQSRRDAGRILALGAMMETVFVTGNIKYDQTIDLKNLNEAENVIHRLHWEDDPKFIAGSTHSGEESMIINTYSRLLTSHPRLKLIIAPRHLERIGEVQDLLAQHGMTARIRSHLKDNTLQTSEDGILLLDTMGELTAFFSIADVAFVGGSLVNIGGHNVLEPAAVGKPVLFGPHTQNFKDASAMLLKNKAARRVENADALSAVLTELFEDDKIIQKMGRKGMEVIRANQGAVSHNIELIRALIEKKPLIQTQSKSTQLPHTNPYTSSKRIEDRVFGQPASFFEQVLQTIAHGIAPMYKTGLSIRRFLYQSGCWKTRKSPVPVVSIGNLSVGGTGKTPLVMHLVSHIASAGYHPAVISRGYRSRLGSVPCRVPLNGSAADFGDEPVMMTRSMPGIPVIISRNRFRGVQLAHSRHAADCAILDDGFQHWGLFRDLNIVLLDVRFPVNSEKLLPAGRLREPPDALARADLIVFTHSETSAPHSGDLALIRQFAPDIPIFYARYQFKSLRIPLSDTIDPAPVTAQSVCLISGIGDPSSFRDTAAAMGARITLEISYPDHYRLTPDDWHRSLVQAKNAGCRFVLITAKDEVRLTEDMALDMLPVRVADIEYRIEPKNEFYEAVMQVLKTDETKYG